jgi:negative regulator of replication initiation
LDWQGGQVDDGLYKIINDHTVHIGDPGANFRFRILNGNKLMLTPVLTKAMVRQAVAHPAQFSGAGWAVSVAYAGHTWRRAPCSRWC